MGEVIHFDAVERKRLSRLLAKASDALDQVRTACETEFAAYNILAGAIGYRSDYPETADAISDTLSYIDRRLQLLATADASAAALAEANRLLGDLRDNATRWSKLFAD